MASCIAQEENFNLQDRRLGQDLSMKKIFQCFRAHLNFYNFREREKLSHSLHNTERFLKNFAL